MENIVQLVFNYGIGFVIVGLFIYDWFTNKKDVKMTLKQNEKCLGEISVSGKNTEKSLTLLQQSMNLVQQSMDEQKEMMITHDKKTEHTQFIVEEIKNNLEKR